MRAGKLDKTISIESYTSTRDEFGQPVEAWAPLGTYRAQIVQATNEEFFASGQGLDEAQAIVFRTRYIPGMTLASRVTYDGQHFNIVDFKELGRRQGLDIRATVAEGRTT